jgi:hypothetical protein
MINNAVPMIIAATTIAAPISSADPFTRAGGAATLTTR